MRPVSLAILGALLLAVLLIVLSLATNVWQTSSYRSLTSNSGLWKSCINNACFSYSVSNASLDAVRAFIILAMLAQGMAILGAGVRMFKVISANLFIPVLVLTAAAAACLLIGLSVYARKFKPADVIGITASFGWSYFIGWVAFVIDAVAVVLTAVLDRNSE